MTGELMATMQAARLEFRALMERPAQLAEDEGAMAERYARRKAEADGAPAADGAEAEAPAQPEAPAAEAEAPAGRVVVPSPVMPGTAIDGGRLPAARKPAKRRPTVARLQPLAPYAGTDGF